MSIMIEVTSQEVRVRSGTSQRTQRAYSLREQDAYFFKSGAQYPEKIKLTLEDNQPAYQPGVYELSQESFFVDRFGSLAVKPRLIAKQKAPVQPVKQG